MCVEAASVSLLVGVSDGGEQCAEEGEGLWGPLKAQVNVKIADLGNACWVVSEPLSLALVIIASPPHCTRTSTSLMTFRRGSTGVLRCCWEPATTPLLTYGAWRAWSVLLHVLECHLLMACV